MTSQRQLCIHTHRGLRSITPRVCGMRGIVRDGTGSARQLAAGGGTARLMDSAWMVFISSFSASFT